MNSQRLENMIENFEDSLESKFKWNSFEQFKSFLYKNPSEVENYVLTSTFIETLNVLKELGKYEGEVYSKRIGRNMYKPIEPLNFDIFSSSYGSSLESSFINAGFQVVGCENEDSLLENNFEDTFYDDNSEVDSGDYNRSSSPLNFTQMNENRRFE